MATLAGQSFSHILVVKLRTLGDILTTFPLLRALKERHPAARLSFVADDTYQDLFAAHPRVDAVWPHPVRELRSRGAGFALRQQAAVIRRIRAERVDLFIDLYGSLRTAVWGALAGVPDRMGFNLRGRRVFYNHRIEAPCRYVVDLNLEFARRLGWQGTERSLEFFLRPEDRELARAHLTAQGWDERMPSLVVSPGGGWPVKCWAPERFGQAADALRKETGCQLIVSGTPAEKGRIEACARAAGEPVLRAVGLPLRTAAAVIREARLFLGNDSGPKYFAEAFGIPTLICYGPTDYLNNNPDSPRHRVACREVACRPCHSEICRTGDRACLDGLAVDEVVRLGLDLWRG